MSRASRTLALFGITALAGGTVLLAAGRHLGWRWHGPFGLSPATENLAALAPADSEMVVFADVAALRSSPLIEQLKSMLPSPQPDADYAAFVRASGFDYQRDLDKVLVASHQVDGKAETVAIAEGRFDRPKIRSYALANGKLERQDGYEVYLLPSSVPGAQGKTIAMAFLSDTRIAISDSENLDAILVAHKPPAADPSAAQAGGAAPAASDISLAERVSREGDVPIYVISRVPDEPANWAPGGVHSDQLNDLARSVRWIDVTIAPMPDRLHVTLEGECIDQAKATSLENTLTGMRFLAEAYLGTPGAQKQLDPQSRTLLGQLLDSAVVTNHDQWVALSVDLTQDLLKNGLQHTPHAGSPAAPPTPAAAQK
jgi:hypothetical protein